MPWIILIIAGLFEVGKANHGNRFFTVVGWFPGRPFYQNAAFIQGNNNFTDRNRLCSVDRDRSSRNRYNRNLDLQGAIGVLEAFFYQH